MEVEVAVLMNCLYFLMRRVSTQDNSKVGFKKDIYAKDIHVAEKMTITTSLGRDGKREILCLAS